MARIRKTRRHVDYLSIASIFTIGALVANLIVIALCNPATQGFVGGTIVGIGSAGLILFRQIRKANRSLVASEAKARYVATHDSLTQLPNRLMFVDHLADFGRSDGSPNFAILCVRLDRVGGPAGGGFSIRNDEILGYAAAQLNKVNRPGDMLARLGDDTFAILAPATGQAEAEALVGTMQGALALPCETSGGPVYLTLSAGASLNSSGTRNPLDILTEAQTALAHADELGGGRFCFFEPGMHPASKVRESLESDLRRAIAEGGLKMVYQPQVNAKGVTTGVEGLLRWPREGQAEVPPGIFLPLAEAFGLGPALGMFALKQAFIDSRRWPGLRVAVNITSMPMRDELVSALKALLAQTGADPHRLELEITEASLVDAGPETSRALDDIRKLGFSIALDDFGTGHSSLTYLRRFAVDKIKIDKSFTARLGTQADAGQIVQAIFEMGAALDLKIMAEGVESRAQLQFLLATRCSLFQGCLFCRPVEATAIDDLISGAAKLAA